MEKHKYQGKTVEEAIEQAKIDLQETEENDAQQHPTNLWTV